jgi:hypothetical protein
MHRVFLAALILVAVLPPCEAKNKKPPSDGAEFDKRMYDPLNEAQVKVAIMTSMARIAGNGDNCPRYKVNLDEVFEELRSADITPTMLDTQGFKNAQTMAIVSAVERMNEDKSDWCLAVWQLFGPNGTYRRQMLDAK